MKLEPLNNENENRNWQSNGRRGLANSQLADKHALTKRVFEAISLQFQNLLHIDCLLKYTLGFFFLTMLGNGALGLWSVFVSVRFCRRFREMCGCNWSILTASEEQGLYS